MERTHERAIGDLIEAFGSLRRPIHAAPAARRGADLVLTLADGSHLEIEVKSLSRVTPDVVDRISRGTDRRAATHVVVADQITPTARDLLTAAGWGWLDRRGHLAVDAPTMVIDTDVPALVEAEGRPTTPSLDTSVGLDVAAAVLIAPSERRSIRALSAFTGRSLGAVHRAVTGLTSEGLLSATTGLPLTQPLFWEVAARWRPRRVALADRPRPGDADRTDLLQLGLLEIESSPGWAIGDVVAANVFGAPAPIAGSTPPDFYVTDPRVVRIARSVYGEATRPSDRGATVAVPPVAWACRHRVDASTLGHNRQMLEFGFVHPVIAALDLASDPGRGREILDDWTPPDPYVRVW